MQDNITQGRGMFQRSTRLLTVTILGLVIAGCASTGLPLGAKVVGGGHQIHWSPDVAGTAILV